MTYPTLGFNERVTRGLAWVFFFEVLALGFVMVAFAAQGGAL